MQALIPYSNVKSKYIKEQIKKANWKADRQYINALVFLEQYILGKTTLCWSTSFILNQMNKDYEIILHELRPKEYAQKIKEERKEREEEKREELKWKREEAKTLAWEKREWAKAGGKIKAGK